MKNVLKLLVAFVLLVVIAAPLMAAENEATAEKTTEEGFYKEENPDWLNFQVELHGYFRVRHDTFSWERYFKYMDEGDENDYLQYFNMRMVLKPTIHFNKFVRIYAQFDLLRNVVFGLNDAMGNILAQDMGTTQMVFPAYLGKTVDGSGNTFKVTRLWAEVMFPFGVFRFGRQPSDWGMGLLSNGGNDLDDDFGDTYDRVLFATRPLSKQGYDQLTIAIAYDRLTEGANFSGTPKFWDDTLRATEYVTAVFWDAKWWFAGLFAIYRNQDPNDSSDWQDTMLTGDADIWIFDYYGRARWKGLYFETEMVHFFGRFDVRLYDPDYWALFHTYVKEAQDTRGEGFEGVWRLGYDVERYGAWAEYGIATGTDERNELHFASKLPIVRGTEYDSLGFDPDVTTDLILFEELYGMVLGINPLGDLFGSRGGVKNAEYWKIVGRGVPVENLECQLDVEYARVIETNDWYRVSYEDEVPTLVRVEHDLGWEIDLKAQYTFAQYFTGGVQFGYAFVGDFFHDLLLDVDLGQQAQLDVPDMWTLQWMFAVHF